MEYEGNLEPEKVLRDDSANGQQKKDVQNLENYVDNENTKQFTNHSYLKAI